MNLQDLLELATYYVGLLCAALFLITFGPSVCKMGQLAGWW